MKLNLGQLASDKPVVTILTVLAAGVAIIVGGIITITNPQSLSFHQYIQDIAFMAGALGLGSGIGRGIDSYGQAVANAQPQGAHVHMSTTDAPPTPPEPSPHGVPGEPGEPPPARIPGDPTPPPSEPPTEPEPDEPGDTGDNPYETTGPEQPEDA